MPFLSAQWLNLALANYSIPQSILQPYVPAKTELDTWNDTCYVSLVGFLFKNTRMLGIPIPFHINFEEVNLRFYVRYKDGNTWKRGVVFIREIVPKPALTFVANTLYRERYATMRMRHRWTETAENRQVEYAWKCQGQWQSLALTAEKTSQSILDGTEAEFITEHYWGYTQVTPHKTFEYEVTHPRWEVYPVLDSAIKVDFEKVYGKPFALLNEMEPISLMLAKGSPITVENKRKL
ncbi:MAG: DUF2071 domain-containing protein [Saprospirales bacterium]|nr:DUF2071 domain-containing protein [Saprospirales bacterium]